MYVLTRHTREVSEERFISASVFKSNETLRFYLSNYGITKLGI